MVCRKMKRVNICNFCNNPFHPFDTKPEQKFCSFECYKRSTRVIKICKNCGLNFETYKNGHSHKDFCSLKCRKEGYISWKKGLTKELDESIRIGAINLSIKRKKLFKEGKLKVCPKSIEVITLLGKSCKGKKKSKEQREKQSRTMKDLYKRGIRRPPMLNPLVAKKLSIALKGRKFSKDSMRKMSETHKIRYLSGESSHCIGSIGKENPSYIHGRSYEPYTSEFHNKIRLMIRKRDNQVCMNCGVHREKLKKALSVHHINYDKTNCLPQNLISLCNSCHSLTNLNREYWQRLFQEKLNKLYSYNYSENKEIIIGIKNGI